MPGSVLVVCYDTTAGRYLAQLADSAQIADEAIISAKIASGAVGTPHVANAAITSAKLASGVIGTPHILDESITSAKLASGAVIGDRVAFGGVFSGKIAAGTIGGNRLIDATITSAKIAANAIGGIHILDGSILSGEIGAAAVGGGKLWDYGVVSGKIASGAITEEALASGLSIDIAEISQEPSYRAQDLVSGYLGVQFSTSGYFNYAQPGDINTVPAVGLAIANILSGQIGTFQHQGRITNSAWDFSGHIGEMLFLGTSSEVTLTAPSASGQCVQRLAKVILPDTIFMRPELTFIHLAE